MTAEEMYVTCRTGDTTLDEFEEWAHDVSFAGYKEGYSDGVLNVKYEVDCGVLTEDKV